jgi:hypothetical protein
MFHETAICAIRRNTCAGGPTYPDYAPGMSVKVGSLTAALHSVRPTPPRQKVANEWNVEIRDERGQPVPEASISNPDSFMPVHNHHGRTPPSTAALSEPGRAQIKAIDFQMRGPWQVRRVRGARRPALRDPAVPELTPTRLRRVEPRRRQGATQLCEPPQYVVCSPTH